MTRGQKGCYIYCTDKETAEYFKSYITGETLVVNGGPVKADYTLKKESEG